MPHLPPFFRHLPVGTRPEQPHHSGTDGLKRHLNKHDLHACSQPCPLGRAQPRVRLSNPDWLRLTPKPGRRRGSHGQPPFPASFLAARTAGVGVEGSAPNLFKGSIRQATYIYISVPSSSHLGSGFGTICTLLMARWIKHAFHFYCVSSCPLHSFVTS
jgi:hypothetical protein